MPIYEVLLKDEVVYVACVVTRYFGGLLLGAGGLVRAYTKGAKDAVDVADIKIMAWAEQLTVEVEYSLYGRLGQIFADFGVRVENEDFADNVKITLCVRSESVDALSARLVDACNGKVVVQSLQKLWFDFA